MSGDVRVINFCVGEDGIVAITWSSHWVTDGHRWRELVAKGVESLLTPSPSLSTPQTN